MGFRQHRVIVALDDAGHEYFGEPLPYTANKRSSIHSLSEQVGNVASSKRPSLHSISEVNEIAIHAADEMEMLDDAGDGAAEDEQDEYVSAAFLMISLASRGEWRN